MNIFDFIRELKGLSLDEENNYVIDLSPLVEKGLGDNPSITDIDVEENNLYDWQKNQTGIKVTISFYVNEKKFEIRVTYNFFKSMSTIGYYNENDRGEMNKMILPDELFDKDY